MRRVLTFLACALFAAVPAWGEEVPKPGDASAGRHPYWIGAMCVPTEPTLRAQLKLENRGLTVVQVLPESPAAQGGLQVHDVVTGINGKPLEQVDQLMHAVTAAGGKELKLDILRGGKPQSLTVRPEKRPVGDVLHRFEGRPLDGEQADRIRELTEKMRQKLPEGEARQMQEWVEKFRRGEQQPLRMHMFGPGVVVHSAGGGLAAPLPEGVSVTIKKTGPAPATITVERGDETWTLSDKELHRLPADLQGPVGGLVGHGAPTVLKMHGPQGNAAAVATSDAGPVQIQIQTDDGNGPKAFTVPLPPPGAAPPAAELERLKKQVEQLQRRLDEMQKGSTKR